MRPSCRARSGDPSGSSAAARSSQGRAVGLHIRRCRPTRHDQHVGRVRSRCDRSTLQRSDQRLDEFEAASRFPAERRVRPPAASVDEWRLGPSDPSAPARAQRASVLRQESAAASGHDGSIEHLRRMPHRLPTIDAPRWNARTSIGTSRSAHRRWSCRRARSGEPLGEAGTQERDDGKRRCRHRQPSTRTRSSRSPAINARRPHQRERARTTGPAGPWA